MFGVLCGWSCILPISTGDWMPLAKRFEVYVMKWLHPSSQHENIKLCPCYVTEKAGHDVMPSLSTANMSSNHHLAAQPMHAYAQTEVPPCSLQRGPHDQLITKISSIHITLLECVTCVCIASPVRLWLVHKEGSLFCTLLGKTLPYKTQLE
jgi:hypothetical protein